MNNISTDETNQPVELILLNEEIKTATKPKLTQALQNRVNEAIESQLQTEARDFIDLIIDNQDQLVAPIKQGIVDYFRSQPVLKELITEIIRLLETFRKECRDTDNLQYMAILGLLHYDQYDESFLEILSNCIQGTKLKKKYISEGFVELFNGAGIHQTVNLLFNFKTILSLLGTGNLEKIKKLISDCLLDAHPNFSREPILKDLDKLQEVMQSHHWVPSAKDRMLRSNMENLVNSSKIRELNIDNITAKNDEQNRIHVDRQSGGPSKDDKEKSSRNKDDESVVDKQTIHVNKETGELSVFPDKIISANKPDGPHKKSFEEKEKNITISNLDEKQETVISNLIEIFSLSNDRAFNYRKQIKGNKKKISRLHKELNLLKKSDEELKVEVSLYQEEYDKIERKLNAMKDKLVFQRQRHTEIKRELENENSELKEKIVQSDSEISRLRESSESAKIELERERQLSHATHRDALNRANVELESKMKAIKQAVSPIFREIDEFEPISDLPSKARMLLNICKKIKNALKTNGVNI